jgi:hypothetical protein
VDLTGSRFNLIRYAVAYEIGRARIRQIVGSGQPPPNQHDNPGGPKP